MNSKEFREVSEEFQSADIDGKIKIYTTAEGLTQNQYKQLLKHFPIEHLDKLEEALM